MLKFRLFGIPVGVDWWFWIIAVLLSGGMSASDADDWAEVLVMSLVIFVSVVVHELGHAFAGRKFGAEPAIKLHGFGGSTFLPGAQFTRSQSIIVSAAGPAAGLSLWVALVFLKPQLGYLAPLARLALAWGLQINFVWTLFNLLPIQPLDGGQILREVLGPRRIQITALIGCVLAAALCVWFIYQGLIFNAFMLGLLAYHNFRRDPVEGGVIKG